MENMKEIVCKNCIRYLGETRLKLVEIERLMGVSNSTVQRWKNGTQAPELDKIDKLAEVLGIRTIDFFLDTDGSDPEIPETSKDQSLEIIQQIASLGPSELEILMDTLKALSKPLPVKAQKKKEA